MKYFWDVEAIVTTPVRVKVIAATEEEALDLARKCAWYDCGPMPPRWDEAVVLSVGDAKRTMA